MLTQCFDVVDVDELRELFLHRLDHGLKRRAIRGERGGHGLDLPGRARDVRTYQAHLAEGHAGRLTLHGGLQIMLRVP